MKRKIQYRWLQLVVLLGAAICVGSLMAGQIRSVQDRVKVANMTEKKKSLCVGRLLVDVPEQANVSLSGEMMDGFEIKTVEESESAFLERVAAREADIAARGVEPNDDGEGGMVEARDLRVPDMVGRALIYGYSSGYLMAGDRRVEMESVSVEILGHMNGLSFSLSAQSTQKESAREAEALLARLRLRTENEIPTESGFCIGRAVFAEPLPPHETEHIVMHIGIPDHPDVGMTLVSIPGGARDSGLLARVAETDGSTDAVELRRVTKMREGRRIINGIDGEEVLERVKERNLATTLGFLWEAKGVKGDHLQPFVSLELQAGISQRPGGKPVDSSLHRDAVLALWDSISSTIRLRQDTPRNQIGTFAQPNQISNTRSFDSQGIARPLIRHPIAKLM